MKAFQLALIAVVTGFFIVYSPIFFGQLYFPSNAMAGGYNGSAQATDGRNDYAVNTTIAEKGGFESFALFTSSPFGMPAGPFLILGLGTLIALFTYLLLRKGIIKAAII